MWNAAVRLWVRVFKPFEQARQIAGLEVENKGLAHQVQVLKEDNERWRKDFMRLVDINMVVTGRIPINDENVSKEFGIDAPTMINPYDEEDAPSKSMSRMRDFQRYAQEVEDKLSMTP